ncbi:MAG: PKD domain-containing protein, partial [Candidatus Poribacteria bacterium]
TSKGDRWYFTVKPKDGLEFGKEKSSSEEGIGNKPPIASKSVITPSSPLTTDDLTCKYEYADENGDLENGTEIKWFKNGEEQSLFMGQKTIPSNATAKGEKWHFTVKPKDGTDFGELKTSLEVTIGNTPPIAKDIVITPLTPKTGNSLECKYAYKDIDEDVENGTEIKWYKDDVYQSTYKNKTVVSAGSVKKGQVWYVTIKPRDGSDFGELMKSASVTIGNMPPIADDLKIKPSSPKIGDDLTGEYTYTDPDDDTEKGTEITWYRNGIAQSSIKELKVSSSAISKGEKWHFTVMPRDGVDYGALKTSSDVTINNTLPVASKLIISPSSPLTTDDLTCKYEYADGNGDKESGTEIKWFKNGKEQSLFMGQRTVPSNATKKGEKWHFTIRPKDGTDFGELKTSSEVFIGNIPPIVKDIVIIPPNPKKGDSLECKYTYTDIDEDSEDGTEIKWYKDDVFQSSKFLNPPLSPFAKGGIEASDLAKGGIVPSGLVRKGQVWYVTIKPRDGSDFGELMKSVAVTIGNMTPNADNLKIKPSNPKIDNDLTCEYTYTDPDDDSEKGTNIIWYKDGVSQELLKDKLKVSSSAISKGDKWHFTVKPNDGVDFGELKTSSPVTVANTAPIADKLMIIPSNPKARGPLECKWTFIDADDDKENGSEIKWFKDGVEQKQYIGLIIPQNITAKSERWNFTIKPKDGVDFGELKTSPTVIIGNTLPVADSLVILTINPRAGDPIKCSYKYSDADGDIENGTDLRWYKIFLDRMNGVEQTQYAGQQVISANTLKGEQWYFTVKPKDGIDYGEMKTSDIVSIKNTVPVADRLIITPSNPLKSDALVIEYEYKDKDNDAENGTEIKWFKDGVEQAQYSDLVPPSNGRTEQKIPPNSIAKGERWHFTVKPKDGTDFGDVKTSLEVVVGNNPPIVSDIFIEPSEPKARESLKCIYTYSDADNDIEDGTEIKWYRDDIYQSNPPFPPLAKGGIEASDFSKGGIVPSDLVKKGQVWHVSVRPKDGIDFGEEKASSIVSIKNTAPIADDLKIEPSSALTNDDLSCSYSYNDVDDDPENGTNIMWYKDGVSQESFNNQLKVSSSAISKGDKWHFAVRPKDGFSYGEFKVSTIVVIKNTPPSADNLVINPAKPTPDDDLICAYQYIDADDDPENNPLAPFFKGEYNKENGTQIRWFKDSILLEKYNNANTIPSSELDTGQTWYFTIQPNDGTQFGVIKQSDFVKIGDRIYIPPKNLYLPVVSDLAIAPKEPFTDDDLHASYAYADLDGDPENGTELKWYKNDIYQKDRDNYGIISASEVSKGDKWYFTVKPGDGVDFGALKTSAIVIVQNSPPTVKDISITPLTPKKTDNLICNYIYSDADNDFSGQNDIETGTEIRWFKDNQMQVLYNNQRIIPPNELSKGEKWYFTVKPKDGVDYGELKTSDIVSIKNSAPSALNINISPKSLLTEDDILCNYDYADADNDAELGTEIRWFKDDQIQATYNDQRKIPSSETTKGQKWYFTIRPRDGFTFGDILVSEIVTIGDSNPLISNLKITPSSPTKIDSLSSHYRYSDPDFDIEISTEIKWLKNGEPQLAYDNQTFIPSDAIKKGDKWNFRIRTRYDKGWTDWQETGPIIVRNTPPVAIIKSDSQVIAVNSPIKFFGFGSFDVDGDALSYRWDFNANDGISTEDSSEKNSHIYDKSGEYVVTLIVNDGEEDSISAIFNLRVENRSRLLGASYNIPDEKLTLKFNKPIKPEMAKFDGEKIRMEIADSGKADLL